MIIYNKAWLSNLTVLENVKRDYEEGLIPDSEWAAIKAKYSHGFYIPHLFIRAGLFFLTVITCIFSSGFLSLMLADSGFIDSYGWILFLAIAHYVALEVTVQQKFHFRSGVDDALLWIFMGLLTIAYIMGTDADETPLVLAIFIFVVSALLAVRFADTLMSLLVYLSALAAVFFLWKELGAWGISTMPFILMAFSGSVYRLVKKNLNNPKTAVYQNSMSVLQIAGLLSLYAAGNYFAVKELGDMLNGTESKSIPFGWFFWAWTVGMPVVYIFFGVKQKNVILLRTGLLLIAVAAATYKTYYQLMPLEFTLLLCGAAAVVISYFLIRYLQSPKYGFTYKKLSAAYLMDELKVESLIVSESFAETGIPPANTGTEFGGGQFGGGGASSRY